jgi:hypothetical protein
MDNPWASSGLSGTGDVFKALHVGLTVGLISTPVNHLKTCTPHELISDVLEHSPEDFDFLPVVDDDDQFIGMFHAAAYRDRRTLWTVWQSYMPLSENYLIGADASILDFLIDADDKQCRLVISGTKVVGLVSLSDLQKLPVRAALFALITGLEITMADIIRMKYPNNDDWIYTLTKTRQEKIKEEHKKAKSDDGFVDSLLFTQFCDKRDILKEKLPERQRNTIDETLVSIENLRNSVAHANEYASTPHQAKSVCSVVRNLLNVMDQLQEQLAAMGRDKQE